MSKESELAEQNAKLIERNAELEARVVELEAIVEKLRELLTSNSSNSSKPPSTDRGKNPHRNKAKGKKKRKRGPKKGHPGAQRKLIPLEDVDEVHEHFPETCCECATPLPRQSAADPVRHQTFELPTVRPLVREDRRHSVVCPDHRCGAITTATLPAEVSAKVFGPSIVMTVALLTGMYRLSKRNVVSFMDTFFGLDISVGGVSRCEAEASEALATSHTEAMAAAQRQPTAYVDETSWQVKHKTHWLWVMVTKIATVFLIRPHRDTATAKEILGDFDGTLVADRLATYFFWDGHRQVCWAHLKRLFVRFSEAKEGTFQYNIGQRLLASMRELFAEWHRFRNGEIARTTLKRRTVRARREILSALDDGELTVDEWLSKRCENVLKYEQALFTFIFHDELEPTNNDAERALRHGVISRKLSFGTQSDRGSRFLERIFTTVETLRTRDGDVALFVHDTVAAHRRGVPGPSLLTA